MLSLPNPMLDRASKMVATIHHSHGVKAAVAIAQLQAKFPNWDEAFWDQALNRACWYTEPLVPQPMPGISAGSVSPKKAYAMVVRGVVPYAYSAVREWVRQSSADTVVQRFIDEACKNPGYLGHRLSVLLSFAESIPLFTSSPYEDLWIDRLTEYLIACRFGSHETPPPQVEHLEHELLMNLTLRKPGYFGHHLITLMWILRNQSRLNKDGSEHAMQWVAAACNTSYSEDEDNVVIDDTMLALVEADSTELSIESVLVKLLTGGVPNIHLITLADALAWLWDICSPQQQKLVCAVAQKFTLASEA